jgi:hypothetical protein
MVKVGARLIVMPDDSIRHKVALTPLDSGSVCGAWPE